MSKIAHYCGVDMGTSRLVCARYVGAEVTTRSELNAYIQVKDTPAARKALESRRVPFHPGTGVLQIHGAHSVPFSQAFDVNLERTMKLGCLNSVDENCADVLARITLDGVGAAQAAESPLVFSVPSPPASTPVGEEPARFIHHRMVLQRMFEQFGYQATPLAEGEAVVYAELGDTGYTGIGVSFGAGLVNVALNYMALPVTSFSLQRGGDFVDESSASVTGGKTSRMRHFKESKFALTADNLDPTSRAIHMFYVELIEYVAEGIAQALTESDNVAQIDTPVPVVVAGGTSMPKGFMTLFERALRRQSFPLEIAEVRAAKAPLLAVAIGCLEYAKIQNA